MRRGTPELWKLCKEEFALQLRERCGERKPQGSTKGSTDASPSAVDFSVGWSVSSVVADCSDSPAPSSPSPAICWSEWVSSSYA